MARSSRREPKVGDLVHHWIFPRHEWVGLLLRIDHKDAKREDKAFVRMVPGTKYEEYFRDSNGNGTYSGWVYKKWLWVYDGGRTDVEIIEAFFHRKQ